MTEAAFIQFRFQIRHLFEIISSFKRPKYPQWLYEQFENKMIEDFIHQGHPFGMARMIFFTDIQNILLMHGMKCSTLGLLDPEICLYAVSH